MLANQPLCFDRDKAFAVTPSQLNQALKSLPQWQCIRQGDPKLEREYRLADFAQALAFAQVVGQIAEQAGHHPILVVAWGVVKVQWWTHEIHNIHNNDLILAAKTDQAYTAQFALANQ